MMDRGHDPITITWDITELMSDIVHALADDVGADVRGQLRMLVQCIALLRGHPPADKIQDTPDTSHPSHSGDPATRTAARRLLLTIPDSRLKGRVQTRRDHARAVLALLAREDNPLCAVDIAYAVHDLPLDADEGYYVSTVGTTLDHLLRTGLVERTPPVPSRVRAARGQRKRATGYVITPTGRAAQ